MSNQEIELMNEFILIHKEEPILAVHGRAAYNPKYVKFLESKGFDKKNAKVILQDAD